jgi:aspartate racemase
MDFEARIHRISQHQIPQQGNSGYPAMVVYYYRHAPVLMQEEGLPVFPLQPDPRLLEAAKKLGACVDFLVITANGPHLFQAAIEEVSGRNVLSMIETTLQEVNRRGLKKVGVLGLGEPTVYLRPLEEQGIACECISQELSARLDQAILRLMAGEVGSTEKAIAIEAVDVLRVKQVDGIILGCTEIPLLLQEQGNAADLINPAQLLAEAAVRYALE